METIDISMKSQKFDWNRNQFQIRQNPTNQTDPKLISHRDSGHLIWPVN